MSLTLPGGIPPSREHHADCVLREDAATAEVSRSQLWQWVRHGITTSEGKKVDKAYALKLLKESADELSAKAPRGNKYHLAAQYFAGQVTGEDYADFLTTWVSPSPDITPSVGTGDHGLTFSRLLYDEITAVGSASPASKL